MASLSKRLVLVASFIKPAQGFIDIGADGGLIVIKLAKEGFKGAIYASEYQNGPYQRLVKGIKEAGLEKKITILQGDGLKVLKNPSIEEALLSGMGGELIGKIIHEGKENLKQLKRIIIEPQSEPSTARKALIDNGFTEENGLYLKERGHYYPLESYIRGSDQEDSLALEFGKSVLIKPDPVFSEFLIKEEKRLALLLEEKLPPQKQAEIKEKLSAIKEAERRIA